MQTPFEILFKMRRIKRRGDRERFDEYLRSLTKEEWEKLREFANVTSRVATTHIEGHELLEQIGGKEHDRAADH